MLLSVITILSTALFGSVLAQSSSGSSTSTSSAPGATHTFSVGADGRTFTPHEHTADVGDIIEYRFYPQNHSVVKAAFGPEPCVPYEITGAGRVGWWSGWEPIAVVTSDPPIFRIRINDTEPLFFYCSSPGACMQGMVGVVNPNATFTYEAQLAYTQNATAFLSPGEYFPEEKLPETTRGGSSPTSTSEASNGSHPHTLSAGAIAGIAIGGVAVLILAAALLYMCGRHKSFKDILRHSTPKDANAYQPASPGFSEAHYPNMLKSPAMTDSRFSAQTYGADSYRSISPPIDERSNGMVGIMMNGHPSPGTSVGWPSPSPRYEEMHEADPSAAMAKGVSSAPQEVHELAAPAANLSPNRSPMSRNFSFTNSESGYTGQMRDSKTEPRP